MKKQFNIRLEYLMYSFIFIGVAISLIQFFYARSLWIDEAKLALNLIDRSYAELLQPLDNEQVAPILFLWAEKFFGDLIGPNEYGYRIFPLMCFWASILLLYKFLKQITNDQKVILVAVAFFSISYRMFSYGVEAKQYIVDVAVALLLFYVTVKDYRKNRNRVWTQILVGCISIFLSNIGIVILTACGLYLLLFSGNLKESLRKNILIYTSWLAAFGFYYFNFIAGHPSKDFMLDYWMSFFMPLNPFTIDFWGFHYASTKMVFAELLSYYQLWPLLFLLFLIGIYSILRNKNLKLLLLIITPIAVHLVLSGLMLYPFFTRLILYLIPGYVIAIAYGTTFLYKKIKAFQVSNVSLLAPVLILIIPLAAEFPNQREEIKHSLDFVESKYVEGDEVYFYDKAIYAFEFYKKTGVTNIKERTYFTKAQDIEEVARDTERFFLVYSHVYPEPGKTMTTLEKTINDELLKEWELQESHYMGNSSAYLYKRINKRPRANL